MSRIVFKRLFELRLLHEYFLMNENGESVFDLPELPQLDLLRSKLRSRQYDVQKEFLIRPTPDTERVLRNYRLKFANMGLGAIVGTEVETEDNGAGDITYRPLIEWNNKDSLFFTIQATNPYFRSFTNTRMNGPLPAIYYFSNIDKTPLLSQLTLSNEVAPFDANQNYEMGELANVVGTVSEALFNTNLPDPANWAPINDHRYASEADRILLPQKFMYRFAASANVTEATFVLRNTDGDVIKSITKTSTQTITNALLNFKIVEDGSENPSEISAGYYHLEVNTNTGISTNSRLLLNDELYNVDYIGIIEIRLGNLDPAYQLLDAAGNLITRVTAGVREPHPIYELRFQARRTYWRYISERDFTLNEINDTSAYLTAVSNKVLVSDEPLSLSHSLVPVDNTIPFYLPMPDLRAIRLQDNRFFSDVFITSKNKITNN